MTPINNVGDLLDALASIPRETPIRGTWEGCQWDVFMYLDAEGRVILDEDECHYQTKWQKSKCQQCDQLAIGAFDGTLFCQTHCRDLNLDYEV